MKKKIQYSRVLRTNFQEKYLKEGVDFYHNTIRSSFYVFIGIFVGSFLGLNAIFAFLYFSSTGFYSWRP
jgi:hypothetical protein